MPEIKDDAKMFLHFAPSSHKKTIYSDDIYVGYRANETFDVLGKKVEYPFGYGCSYTTFDIAVRDVEVNEDVVSGYYRRD